MRIKAAVLNTIGAAPPFAETRPLAIEDIDLAAPGPGEVRVKIGAAGLCHSDLSVINGDRPRPMPMALGHETAGVVEELGEGAGCGHAPVLMVEVQIGLIENFLLADASGAREKYAPPQRANVR